MELNVKLFGASLFIYLLSGLSAVIANRKPRAANWISHSGSLLGGMVGTAVAIQVLLSGKSFSFSLWTIISDVNLSFRVDPLSAFFLLIISVLSVAVSIYSIGYVTEYYQKKNMGLLGAGFNMFLFSMIAVVTMDNGLTFLLAWELMSLISFLLVMVEHEKPDVRRAGYVYVTMTHFGTAFIILSFLTLFFFSGSFEFSSFQRASTNLPATAKNLVFFMAFIGFGSILPADSRFLYALQRGWILPP